MIFPVAKTARSSIKLLTVVLTLPQSPWKPTWKSVDNTWKHLRILKVLKNVSISAIWRGKCPQSMLISLIFFSIFFFQISIRTVWSGTAWVTNTTLTNIQIFGTRRFVIWKNLLMVLLMQHSWLPGSLFMFAPHRNIQKIMQQLGKIFVVLRFVKIMTSKCKTV